MTAETAPTQAEEFRLRAQHPHPFVESKSLFASERLLCGHCNRESYNPVHEPSSGGER